MIIQMQKNKGISQDSPFLCNQYENQVAEITVNLPDEYVDAAYFYYMICKSPNPAVAQFATPLLLETDPATLLPLNKVKYIVGSNISWTSGEWEFCLLIKSVEMVDGAVGADGIVAVSEYFRGKVKSGILDTDALAEQPADPNLTIVYDSMQADYSAAELNRDSLYSTAEIARDGLYQTAEGNRDSLFDVAEQERTVAEAARVEADILRGQTVEAIEVNYAPRLTSAEALINDLDAQVTTKASQSALDITNSNVANNASAIASLGSGSPKGTYATVSDLTTAFPTGNTNIYVVTADDNWYYWNGSAWTAGGQYQSSAAIQAVADDLAEHKSNYTQLSNCFDITESINLFDPNSVASGYIADINGSITQSSDWYHTTNYIPVVSALYDTKTVDGVVSRLGLYFVRELDALYNGIGYKTTLSGEYYVPSSADVKYIQFSYHYTNANIMVAEGITAQPYLPYGYTEITNIKNDYIPNDIKELANVLDIVQTKNLHDSTTDKAGYINSSGGLSQSGDWYSTDYIDVSALASVVISGSNGTVRETVAYFCTTYDANKTRIGYINSGNAVSTFAVAVGVKYIRFSYHHDTITDVMVEEGTIPSAIYVEYGTKQILKQDNINRPHWNKKWVAIGDSLTEKNVTAPIKYADYISNALGMRLINMGVGGTGYMRGYDSSNAFYQRVANIPSNADIITIFGSGNDLSLFTSLGNVADTTTDTICGCVNNTLDTIFSICPLVPVIIIAPTPWLGNTPDIENVSMGVYSAKLKEIAERRGCYFVDLFHHSGLRPNDTNQRDSVFYNDGVYVHPNSLGHKLFVAPQIQKAIETVLNSYA